MYPTLDSTTTMPRLTFPSLSRAAVRGHRATGARAEPDPRLIPSPAHLRHHQQAARRGRRRERSEGLCKGAGLSPVPGRAGTGGTEPLMRTPVRGTRGEPGRGRQEGASAHRLWAAPDRDICHPVTLCKAESADQQERAGWDRGGLYHVSGSGI